MMRSVKRKLGFVEEQIEIHALVHDEDGSLWAEVPSCPGLFASGATLDELAEGLSEAWMLYHDSDPIAGSRSSVASALTLRVPAFA
jgi:predicted RNase H-like HicB family nuclease